VSKSKGEECSTCGRDIVRIQFLSEDVKGRDLLWDLGLAWWESNFDTDRKELGCEGSGWTQLAQVRVHCRALVGTEECLLVP
jgi:hypothetical protein